MARNYSQIMCAIWDEEEFLALSEAAQRAYFLLVTQKDISAAGVLHMWIPRWVAMSRTATEESLKAALHELKVARYIVPDWITGELLVRTFVKWDGGYTNLKRKPLIIREALGVRSVEIKRVLRGEFEKLNLPTDGFPEPPPPTGTDSPPDRASDRANDGGHDSNGIAVGLPSPSTANGVHAAYEPSPSAGSGPDAEDSNILPFRHVDRASDSASDVTSPSTGVVGGTEVTTGVPQPHTPQPVPPPAGNGAPGTELALIDAEFVVDAEVVHAGTVTAAWAEDFATTGNRPTKGQRGQVGREAQQLLEAGNDPHRVIAAARALGRKGRSTLVAELAIQTVPDRRAVERQQEPNAFAWQHLKHTGTGGT